MLPGRTRLFFQRQFFATYNRPFQVGGFPPFPRDVNIATIQAPKNQAIVIRSVSFSALQHSGIGLEDLMEVPAARAKTYLGFKFTVGNRGISDFQTNLPTSGVPIVLKQNQGSVATQAGNGNTFQGVGMVTPNNPGENFATYAMPGDQIQSTAVVIRPPNFDLRVFEVSISGWLAEAKELERIIDMLSR